MFFKNISNIAATFSILFLCNISSNINAMDGIIKLIGNIITKTIQADDNQAEKHIFYYEYHPITERSFNQLRKIAFEVYFDSSITTDLDNTSQEFIKSLYNTWKDQFNKEHESPNLETTSALANIVKHHITIYHTDDLQRTVTIEYNDITTEFNDGMALLLYDINRAYKKSYDDLERKGKKIQW